MTRQPTLIEVLDGAERDFEQGHAYLLRGKLVLHKLSDYAETMKAHRPNWQTARDEDAQLVRRIERLRLEQEPPAEQGPSEMVTVTEAASRLRMVKPSGKPTDRFYKRVLPTIGRKAGSRWIIHRDALDTYMRGGEAR
jgi:hypothetical protein